MAQIHFVINGEISEKPFINGSIVYADEFEIGGTVYSIVNKRFVSGITATDKLLIFLEEN